MTKPIRLSVERLRRLRRDDDIWQGGFVRMPAWVTPESTPPYRPLLPIWVSARSGRVEGGDPAHPDDLQHDVLLDALIRLAENREVGCRPAALEVRDPLLADLLRERLEGTDIEVRLAARTQALDEVAEAMARDLSPPFSRMSVLTMPGVNLPRLRSFAEAAAAFYRAAFWNYLSDEDPIQIESDVPDQEMSSLAVLGAGGIEYGLGFFPSVASHRDLRSDGDPSPLRSRGAWMLSYGPIMDLPFPDSELWEHERLPLAGDLAYPLLVRFRGEEPPRFPDARRLTFVEGLLRALAGTTEDRIDAGRWGQKVSTFDGTVRYEFSIPSLLAPDPPQRTGGRPRLPDRRLEERVLQDVARFVEQHHGASMEEINRLLAAEYDPNAPPSRLPDTPQEAAQAYVYEAAEAVGRQRVRLAREALRAWPDCADAYVIQAEEMPDPARRMELYRLGLEAGKRSLGQAGFAEHAGCFWGIVATRPYMRALAGLADCLDEEGKIDAAIDHWREMLRLNPNDNQGARDLLVPPLLRAGRDDEADEVLRRYREDDGVPLGYCRALLAFRREGDSAVARALLAAAVRSNPHVPKYLLGKRELPDELPDTYAIGSEEEAVTYGSELFAAWFATPGTLGWLEGFLRERKKALAAKRKRAHGKR